MKKLPQKIMQSKMPIFAKKFCIKILILYTEIVILKSEIEEKILNFCLKNINKKIEDLKKDFRVKF